VSFIGYNCTSAPAISFSGVGSGATANVALSTDALTLGQRITTTTGVAALTNIVSGTTPNYVVSVPQLVTGQVTMTAVQTFCNNPTIWGSGTGKPNVDMAGIYNSTQMNSYNAETVPGNGCQ
jgi:hypothetical protein